MDSRNDAPRIRDARVSDSLHIAALLDQLGFPAPESTIAERLERMRTAGEAVIVAECGGRVAALMTVHITPVLHRPTAVARITALVVDEAQRGSGVGRALVGEAERLAMERGCALIEVTSNVKWTGAHAFYERLGYAMTSHRFGKTLPPAR